MYIILDEDRQLLTYKCFGSSRAAMQYINAEGLKEDLENGVLDIVEMETVE